MTCAVINTEDNPARGRTFAGLPAHIIGVTAHNMLRHPMDKGTGKGCIKFDRGRHDRFLDMRGIVKAGNQIAVFFFQFGLGLIGHPFLLFKLPGKRFAKTGFKPQL